MLKMFTFVITTCTCNLYGKKKATCSESFPVHPSESLELFIELNDILKEYVFTNHKRLVQIIGSCVQNLFNGIVFKIFLFHYLFKGISIYFVTTANIQGIKLNISAHVQIAKIQIIQQLLQLLPFLDTTNYIMYLMLPS